MRLLFVPALVIVTTAITSRASAADIPIFDIDQICTKAAANALPLANRCIEDAQTSYDALKTRWKSSTDEDQAPCIEKAKLKTDATVYQLLNSCLTAATAARKVREDAQIQRHFKP